MGVRPEAVLVAREEAPGLRPLEAHFIEPLGAYDIVDLKVGERYLKARTASGFVREPRRPGVGAARRGPGAFLRRDHRRRRSISGSTMAEIGLHGITKRFGRVKAVDELTLTLADGEFFVLLGPTGAGKTTTLRLIAGLELPDAGRISIGGEDATGWSVAQRDVALVFQYYSLYPRYTVRQNLAFPLQVEGARTSRPTRSSGGWRGRRRCSGSSTCSSARPTSSPAARCSGSRSAAPSCATRRCS